MTVTVFRFRVKRCIMSRKLYSNNGKFQNNEKPSHKRRTKLSWVKYTLLAMIAVALLAVMGVSAFLLHNENAEKDFQKLAAQTSMETAGSVATTETSVQSSEPTESSEVELAAMEPKEILPQYKDLYEQNNEIFGWLTIPDTKIDYPVMYTPSESEKYLHAAFDGSYSYAGTPFIDINCQPDSQNLLIYAHNMPNGSMFRNLLKFQEKTYWQKHPTITFNTIYEEGEYEIVAAFYDRLYLETETDVFKFYYFIDPETKAEFEEGIAEIKAKALYDTGIEVNYGDKLITLVTCAYQTTHGRFAVLARQTAN